MKQSEMIRKQMSVQLAQAKSHIEKAERLLDELDSEEEKGNPLKKGSNPKRKEPGVIPMAEKKVKSNRMAG